MTIADPGWDFKLTGPMCAMSAQSSRDVDIAQLLDGLDINCRLLMPDTTTLVVGWHEGQRYVERPGMY